MITSECICRTVFFSTTTGNCGTCFSYEKENVQYLITAKHIFHNINYPTKTTVNFTLSDGIHTFDTDIYYHNNELIDIAIMKIPDTYITKVFENAPCYSMKNIILGQDVFFLGFPYGNYTDMSKLDNENPMPFIKKACLSGLKTDNGVSLLFLDGINNEGFSGGPVCFKNEHNHKYHIAGIINGYRWHPNYINNSTENEESKEDYIKSNTGIIISTNIKHAIEIIDSIDTTEHNQQRN